MARRSRDRPDGTSRHPPDRTRRTVGERGGGRGADMGGEGVMEFSRKWAMPNHETFSVKPIGDFVKKYIRDAAIVIDPFSRNRHWADHTNDLDPSTEAEHH